MLDAGATVFSRDVMTSSAGHGLALLSYYDAGID